MKFACFRNDYGWHLRFAIGRLNFQSKIFSDYKLAWTVGLRNNTPSGHRLLFCDYDNQLLDFVIDELTYLQEEYRLSDIYIFKASQKENSYHAICLDKLTYRQFKEILDQTSVDEYYRDMPVTNDHHSWVLRILEKKDSVAPKLIKILKSKYNIRRKSLAHASYLEKHHKVDVSHLKFLDKNKHSWAIVYGTLNFIDVDDLLKGKSLKNDK